ncbi:unnamed protein product, partial [Vitis vinifera]
MDRPESQRPPRRWGPPSRENTGTASTFWLVATRQVDVCRYQPRSTFPAVLQLWNNLDITRNCWSQTGMYSTRNPIGQDTAATPIHAAHCPQLNLFVSPNFFKNSTATTSRTMAIPVIPQNNLFFFSSFFALTRLKTWHSAEILSLSIPQSVAMALAMNILSPVIILTSTPAHLQVSTASLTPGLHGSSIPTSPIRVRLSSFSFCRPAPIPWSSSGICLCAKAMQRRLLAAMPSIICSNFIRSPSSRSFMLPEAVRMPVLSVQMVVAEPMVSQAESFRTIAWSAIIPSIEEARMSVTAKDKPSGIAAITMVTAASMILTTEFTISTTFKLLTADTEMTRRTATNMLALSYHPSFSPCSLIPKPRESVAQSRSTRLVRSLQASTAKWIRLLAGCLWYVFEPKAACLRATSSTAPPIPFFMSVFKAPATPTTPPASRSWSTFFSLTIALRLVLSMSEKASG